MLKVVRSPVPSIGFGVDMLYKWLAVTTTSRSRVDSGGLTTNNCFLGEAFHHDDVRSNNEYST
jgi:hypothetical protein